MGEEGREGLIQAWEDYVSRHNQGNSDSRIKLNPDRSRVEMLADGVLSNEKERGFRFCPCRMTTGEREKDLKLICPCDFKSQRTWKEKGECWCSLFVRA